MSNKFPEPLTVVTDPKGQEYLVVGHAIEAEPGGGLVLRVLKGKTSRPLRYPDGGKVTHLCDDDTLILTQRGGANYCLMVTPAEELLTKHCHYCIPLGSISGMLNWMDRSKSGCIGSFYQTIGLWKFSPYEERFGSFSCGLNTDVVTWPRKALSDEIILRWIEEHKHHNEKAQVEKKAVTKLAVAIEVTPDEELIFSARDLGGVSPHDDLYVGIINKWIYLGRSADSFDSRYRRKVFICDINEENGFLLLDHEGRLSNTPWPPHGPATRPVEETVKDFLANFFPKFDGCLDFPSEEERTGHKERRTPRDAVGVDSNLDFSSKGKQTACEERELIQDKPAEEGPRMSSPSDNGPFDRAAPTTDPETHPRLKELLGDETKLFHTIEKLRTRKADLSGELAEVVEALKETNETYATLADDIKRVDMLAQTLAKAQRALVGSKATVTRKVVDVLLSGDRGSFKTFEELKDYCGTHDVQSIADAAVKLDDRLKIEKHNSMSILKVKRFLGVL